MDACKGVLEESFTFDAAKASKIWSDPGGGSAHSDMTRCSIEYKTKEDDDYKRLILEGPFSTIEELQDYIQSHDSDFHQRLQAYPQLLSMLTQKWLIGNSGPVSALLDLDLQSVDLDAAYQKPNNPQPLLLMDFSDPRRLHLYYSRYSDRDSVELFTFREASQSEEAKPDFLLKDELSVITLPALEVEKGVYQFEGEAQQTLRIVLQPLSGQSEDDFVQTFKQKISHKPHSYLTDYAMPRKEAIPEKEEAMLKRLGLGMINRVERRYFFQYSDKATPLNNPVRTALEKKASHHALMGAPPMAASTGSSILLAGAAAVATIISPVIPLLVFSIGTASLLLAGVGIVLTLILGSMMRQWDKYVDRKQVQVSAAPIPEPALA